MTVIARRRLVAAACLVSAAAIAACRNAPPPIATGNTQPALQNSISTLTERHTRVVWVQHDGADTHAQTQRLVVGGLDSEDGRGERLIVAEYGNYTKPLLTSDGTRVVFSSRNGYDMHVVNWDGTGRRRIGEGFALAIWNDPDTGTDWLYAGLDREEDAYARVVRFPLGRLEAIERPETLETVWMRSLVGEDSFDLSPDGTRVLAMFPWPRVGLASLPNKTFTRLGDGCWTGLARGDRAITWWLDDAHRNLVLTDVTSDARWSVALDTAPGFEGAEVYHPRATTDPRVIAVTGPFNQGGWNQVRSGGGQVEVYLGRFDEGFTRIADWVRVTNNSRAEAYPDVWLDRR